MPPLFSPHEVEHFTFTIIKTDAYRNGFIDLILEIIREEGFKVFRGDIGGIPTTISADKIVKFYSDHVGKPYFANLVDSFGEGAVPLILYHPDEKEPAFQKLRTLIGPTNARLAGPETIRGRFGGHVCDENAPMAANAIHASDSIESVAREIGIIFPHILTIDIDRFFHTTDSYSVNSHKELYLVALYELPQIYFINHTC